MSGIVWDADGLPLAKADVYAYAPNDAWTSSPDSISGGDWKSTNDMYPFVRGELMKGLPDVAPLMESCWQMP